jgi:type IV pilus assembly protein PilA
LVELGAVVTIVGILAVLAVVGYRKLIASSHNAEATQMVNAIRTAQEAYKAETGTYAAVTGSDTNVLGTSSNTGCNNPTLMYPLASPPAGVITKTAWGLTCTSQCPGTAKWDALPVHVDGPVIYGYTTVAGIAGSTPSTVTMYRNGSTYNLTFTTATTDWFAVAACADTDGDGTYSGYVSTSFSNEIFASNEGE